MLPAAFHEILAEEGVMAIATNGPDGAHLVNTWHSYCTITPGGELLIPAGGMQQTEQNVARDPRVLLTLGSRHVAGARGPGTGFLLRGKGRFDASGPAFESMKTRFPWMRAVLAITVDSVAQTL